MRATFTSAALVGIALTSVTPAALAQQPQASEPTTTVRPGLELFGGASLGWPAGDESFDAAGLNTTSLDFGGGARLAGLWQKLFVQGSTSRWSETGERAFVDSTGEVFPLGIPLDVEATYIDGTIGWKDAIFNSRGRISYLPYVGAGAGIVRYSERSPFAQPGDDLETTKASFHVLAGVEVPLVSWIAAAVEGRYRYVPELFGEDGISAAFAEDSFGGFNLSFGVRIGFGGPRYVRSTPLPAPERPATAATPAPQSRPDMGVMLEAAPVFLLPDTNRTPLRTLPAGESVRILEEKGDWFRIEFTDPQFGARVGYVQRKFVRVRQ